MPASHLKDDNFESEVIHSDRPVLVDFFATWCGPCQMLSPIIEELAADYEGKAKVFKVDVDEAPGVAAKYGIQSIPTLIFFKGGEAVDKKLGPGSKEELAQKLDALM